MAFAACSLVDLWLYDHFAYEPISCFSALSHVAAPCFSGSKCGNFSACWIRKWAVSCWHLFHLGSLGCEFCGAVKFVGRHRICVQLFFFWQVIRALRICFAHTAGDVPKHFHGLRPSDGPLTPMSRNKEEAYVEFAAFSYYIYIINIIYFSMLYSLLTLLTQSTGRIYECTQCKYDLWYAQTSQCCIHRFKIVVFLKCAKTMPKLNLIHAQALKYTVYNIHKSSFHKLHMWITVDPCFQNA